MIAAERGGRRVPRRPGWRDRSDTVMVLRWWRARLSGYLHMREVGRRRDRAQRRPT